MLSRFSLIAQRGHMFYGRLRKAITLGVSAATVDGEGRVLLVKHTYRPGWHLPGSGVEPGETCGEAIARELMEEAGVAPAVPPRLFGIYFNRRVSRRHHIAVYVCDDWRQADAPRIPNLEIADRGFFLPDALPADTGDGSRRRLAELLDGARQSDEW